MYAEDQSRSYIMKGSYADAKVHKMCHFGGGRKIRDFQFSDPFRACIFAFLSSGAALPRNFKWLDMTRRAGMLDLSSTPRRVISVGGVFAARIGSNIFMAWRSVFGS